MLVCFPIKELINLVQQVQQVQQKDILLKHYICIEVEILSTFIVLKVYSDRITEYMLS